MKWLWWTLGVVVVLIGIAAIVALFFLGPIIKKGAETQGPALLGVPVSLGEVKVSPLSGHVSLKNLTVGNPEGFKSPHLLKLGELDIQMRMLSLLSRTIVIDHILVNAPDISYESSVGGSNFGALLKHLEPEEGQKAEGTETKPKPEESGKKVVINRLRIEGARVSLNIKELGGKGIPLVLPTIELTDIGKESGGATFAETLSRVFKGLGQAIAEAGAKSTQFIGKGLKATAEGAKDVGSAVGAEAAKAVQGIGKMLNLKDD